MQSDGQIETIEVSGCTIVVSGSIDAQAIARPSDLYLCHDSIEIARLNLSGQNKISTQKRQRNSRQQFIFRAPIPVGLSDSAALAVRINNERASLRPDRNTKLIGKLPIFLSAADLPNSTQVLKKWEKATSGNRSQTPKRIFFEASESGDSIDGFALDLDCHDRVLILDLMRGPARVARLQADQAAQVELAGDSIELPRGFTFQIPRDSIGEGTEFWIGLSDSTIAKAARTTVKKIKPTASGDMSATPTVANPPRALDGATNWGSQLNLWSRPIGAKSAIANVTVSMIIAVGSDRRILDELLQSIVKAKFSVRTEIILVDGGAITNTKKFPSSYPDLDVKVVPAAPLQARTGYYNVGARAARGDLLAFVDPSIRFTNNILDELVTEFGAPELGIASVRICTPVDHRSPSQPINLHLGCHFTVISNRGTSLPISSTGEPGTTSALTAPTRVPAVDGAFLVCRSDLFSAAGGFDERLQIGLAEADLCVRIRHNNFREVVSFNNLTVACIKRGAASHTDQEMAPELIRCWGSSLIRRLRRDLFDHPAFWSGRVPVVRFVISDAATDADGDVIVAKRLAQALAHVVPCRIELTRSASAYNLTHVDLLVSLDQNFDLQKLTGICPTLTLFAWCRRPEDWRSLPWLEMYHIIGIPTERDRDQFRRRDLRSIVVFPDVVDDELFASKTDAKHEVRTPARLKTIDYKVFDLAASGKLAIHDVVASELLGDVAELISAHEVTSGGHLAERAETNNLLPREAVAIAHSARTRARDLLSLIRAATEHSLRFAIKINNEGPDATSDAGISANALAKELRLLGHHVRVDMESQWSLPIGISDDCIINLGASQRYYPTIGPVNLLWLLQPERVSAAELDGYDHIFVTSARAVEFFRSLTQHPVSELPPAVDFFTERNASAGARDGVVFVGDFRSSDRHSISYALSLGKKVSVYGSGWNDLIPADQLGGPISSLNIAEAVYSKAELVIVDHQDLDHRFGNVRRCTLEAALCGAPVIAKSVPGIEWLLGQCVKTFNDRAEFDDAVSRWQSETDEQKALRLKEARVLSARHSFKERAKVIVAVATQLASMYMPAA